MTYLIWVGLAAIYLSIGLYEWGSHRDELRRYPFLRRRSSRPWVRGAFWLPIVLLAIAALLLDLAGWPWRRSR